MMGTKSYQEKMFYNFSLSKRVPEDHLLRKLEEVLDLRFVREFVSDQYSHTGQPSIDPIVIFKMMLIGYLYGITSERRLADEAAVNLAYLWYLGYDLDEPTPHHSVLSKARSRYGKEVFERFFQLILQKCVEAGLVGGEKVFADSTFIKANASLKSLVTRSEAIEPRYKVKEYVERVFTENPVEEEPATPESPPPPADSQKLSNKTHVSTTDPDSSVISHGQKLPLHLYYKEHFTVDSHARVITAVEVTPGATGDESQLSTLLDHQPMPVKEVCGDTKYGTFFNYHYLAQRNILPSISPWSPGHPAQKRFTINQFLYNPTTDTYTCPGGKTLKRGNNRAHPDRWSYHASKRDCRVCPIRSQCISPALKKRYLLSHIYQRDKDQALLHLQTDHAKTTLRQRKVYAEWINAESKSFHGLRRAMFRGLPKVTIQVFMTASVQNLKRLIKHAFRIAPNPEILLQSTVSFIKSFFYIRIPVCI